MRGGSPRRPPSLAAGISQRLMLFRTAKYPFDGAGWVTGPNTTVCSQAIRERDGYSDLLRVNRRSEAAAGRGQTDLSTARRTPRTPQAHPADLSERPGRVHNTATTHAVKVALAFRVLHRQVPAQHVAHTVSSMLGRDVVAMAQPSLQRHLERVQKSSGLTRHTVSDDSRWLVSLRRGADHHTAHEEASLARSAIF